MLQRLNAMDSELSSLIDGLRTAANRLNADLQLLEGNSRPGLGRAPLDEPEGGRRDRLRGPELGQGPDVEPGVRSVTEPEVAADVDSARLVALNMALNGTPRDETDRYLSENFQLNDRMMLLDEVYSSIQG